MKTSHSLILIGVLSLLGGIWPPLFARITLALANQGYPTYWVLLLSIGLSFLGLGLKLKSEGV